MSLVLLHRSPLYLTTNLITLISPLTTTTQPMIILLLRESQNALVQILPLSNSNHQIANQPRLFLMFILLLHQPCHHSPCQIRISQPRCIMLLTSILIRHLHSTHPNRLPTMARIGLPLLHLQPSVSRVIHKVDPQGLLLPETHPFALYPHKFPHLYQPAVT